MDLDICFFAEAFAAAVDGDISHHGAMQVLGAASADGPWLKAVTERVMIVYCERLSGYAWCSPVSILLCLRHKGVLRMNTDNIA